MVMMMVPAWGDSAYLVLYLIMVQSSLQLDIGKNSTAVNLLIKLQFCLLFQKTAMQNLGWKLGMVLRLLSLPALAMILSMWGHSMQSGLNS